MRVRLILSYAVVVLVSIVSVVLIARRSTLREIQAFMYRGSMIEVDTLVGALETYYRANGDWQGVASLLGPRTGTSGRMGIGGQGSGMMNTRLRLADENGQLIADTHQAINTIPLTSAERRAAQPLRVNGQVVGYLLVESGMGLLGGDSSFLVSRLNRAALIAGVIAGGIALLLALVFSDRLLRPVQQLTGAVRHMAQGDLAQRVAVRGDDELAELGLAFNHMADSLQQAEGSRRAMTADIAHELRTPLAVQRAHLEALQDGIYEANPENLQPVLDQNILLTRLVDDLRILALVDAGQLELERLPTDLVGLAQRIVERFQAQAAGQAVSLTMETSTELMKESPTVNLDALRVEQILGNLLSNALRYTPPGGSILVQVKRSGRSIQIRVCDSGPGIPAEALEHIFERFYRADQARSRSEGGSGLGLAIARQLAEAHGGTLTAENASQGGAVFTLGLPLQ